jgi:hypothetical protein
VHAPTQSARAADPGRHRMIVAAAATASPRRIKRRRLRRSLGRARSDWFEGGHLAQVGRGDAFRAVRGTFAAASARSASPGREFRARDEAILRQPSPKGRLLLDGAMGSLLYERGVLHTRSYDELNISQPDLIARVHRDYMHAGAQVDRDQHLRREPDRAGAPRPGRAGGRRSTRPRSLAPRVRRRPRLRRRRRRAPPACASRSPRERAQARAVRAGRADRHARARRRRR